MVAAISISGITSHFMNKKLPGIVKNVKKAACEISRRLNTPWIILNFKSYVSNMEVLDGAVFRQTMAAKFFRKTLDDLRNHQYRVSLGITGTAVRAVRKSVQCRC